MKKNKIKLNKKVILLGFTPAIVVGSTLAATLPIISCASGSRSLKYSKSQNLQDWVNLAGELRQGIAPKKYNNIKGDFSKDSYYSDEAIKAIKKWNAEFVYYAMILAIVDEFSSQWMWSTDDYANCTVDCTIELNSKTSLIDTMEWHVWGIVENKHLEANFYNLVKEIPISTVIGAEAKIGGFPACIIGNELATTDLFCMYFDYDDDATTSNSKLFNLSWPQAMTPNLQLPQPPPKDR